MSKGGGKGGGRGGGKGGGKDDRTSKQKKSDAFIDGQKQFMHDRRWAKNHRSGWRGSEVPRNDGAVTGLKPPECLAALPRARGVHLVMGGLCLELFCGLASLTLSQVFEAIILRGQCWHKGERRPIAPPKGPKGHVCYAEGVDLLAGNLFLPDQVSSAVACVHSGDADNVGDDEGDDFAPDWLGSKRGRSPDDLIQKALAQPRLFAAQEAKLNDKLQRAARGAHAIKPEALDKIRTRPVDSFTASGINPATRTEDAIVHDAIDHVAPMLAMCISEGMTPRMWCAGDFFCCDPQECVVTGGSCLTAMCGLLGFPTDSCMDGDRALGLAVLGARIALDVAAMPASAAMGANKAQQWTEELQFVANEKKRGPDQAAKSAGRLSFACTASAAQQGRDVAKPLYAQANAPLHGFGMSPALLNAARWWTKLLEIKTAARLAAGHTEREIVVAWQDSQIDVLEMIAAPLFVTTFQDMICGTAAFVPIDNTGVLGSLLKGSSSAPDANVLTRRIWLHAAEWSWAPAWARVALPLGEAVGAMLAGLTQWVSRGVVSCDIVAVVTFVRMRGRAAGVARDKLVARLARLREAAPEAVMWENGDRLPQIAKALSCIAPTKSAIAKSGVGHLLADETVWARGGDVAVTFASIAQRAATSLRPSPHVQCDRSSAVAGRRPVAAMKADQCMDYAVDFADWLMIDEVLADVARRRRLAATPVQQGALHWKLLDSIGPESLRARNPAQAALLRRAAAMAARRGQDAELARQGHGVGVTQLSTSFVNNTVSVTGKSAISLAGMSQHMVAQAQEMWTMECRNVCGGPLGSRSKEVIQMLVAAGQIAEVARLFDERARLLRRDATAQQDGDICKFLAIFTNPSTAANYVGYVKWACKLLSMETGWWSPTVALTPTGMRAEHLRTTGGPALVKVGMQREAQALPPGRHSAAWIESRDGGLDSPRVQLARRDRRPQGSLLTRTCACSGASPRCRAARAVAAWLRGKSARGKLFDLASFSFVEAVRRMPAHAGYGGAGRCTLKGPRYGCDTLSLDDRDNGGGGGAKTNVQELALNCPNRGEICPLIPAMRNQRIATLHLPVQPFCVGSPTLYVSRCSCAECAALHPREVEAWLLGLPPALPREAAVALVKEVHRTGMDGAAFGKLVASRVTPAALGGAVTPANMAVLRRCWHAKFPAGAAPGPAGAELLAPSFFEPPSRMPPLIAPPLPAFDTWMPAWPAAAALALAAPRCGVRSGSWIVGVFLACVRASSCGHLARPFGSDPVEKTALDAEARFSAPG
ncbi:unnamed protein product [Prorocentrum cordatum]|uniref:Uncharacterized protein n=1 Tax=Prorocentrum cordatum TaxID=2364126 RepID=A0ABN9RI50_9DINO|nr:unnamed protein product [Polarella glacialis]